MLGIHYNPKDQPFESVEDVAGVLDGLTQQQLPTRKRKRRAINIDNVDKQFCVAIKPPPPTPAPTLPPGEFVIVAPVITNDSVVFNISTSHAKCSFWDTVTETWGSNGCIVSL